MEGELRTEWDDSQFYLLLSVLCPSDAILEVREKKRRARREMG